MLEQNPDARILVCDPDNRIFPGLIEIISRSFGEHKEISETTTRILRNFGPEPIQIDSVEYTVVNDTEEVIEKVRQQPAPYYSLVVYESSQVKEEEGSIGHISDTRKRDFFIPQMVSGKGIDAVLAGQCARAGVLYFSEDLKETKAQIEKIFRKPKILPNLTLFKFGGSSSDFDRQVKDSYNLDTVCETLISIHQDRSQIKKEREVKRIIVTVGAGQYGDIVKEHTKKYGHNPRIKGKYPEAMAKALQANLEQLKQHLGESGALINTGAFYYIDKSSTSRRIPLIGTAPHYIMARDGIPLQDSDTHTIALAEFYGAERVVLIKRTDGVYKFDPYRGFVLDPMTGKCADLDKWKRIQRRNKNERYDVVTLDEMLSGNLSREGTGIDGKADGSTGHLMEDSALQYMSRCQNVKEIAIVHIAPEEMYYQVGKNRYRHVVTGKTITLDPGTGWKGFLEQSIRDAFKGEACSKIVK